MFVPRPILLAITLCLTGASLAAPSSAGEADVVDAEASRSGDAWRFEVTVRHDDEGWDHYADRWDMVDPATGKVLATRALAHHHDNEQPFTRSLGGVELPDGQKTLLTRGPDSYHG